MSQYKYSDREIKIAEWVGYKWQQSRHFSEDSHWCWLHGRVDPCPRTTGGIPHFDTEIDAAVSLFPLVVKYGGCPNLFYVPETEAWGFQAKLSGPTEFNKSISMAISKGTVKFIDSI